MKRIILGIFACVCLASSGMFAYATMHSKSTTNKPQAVLGAATESYLKALTFEVPSHFSDTITADTDIYANGTLHTKDNAFDIAGNTISFQGSDTYIGRNTTDSLKNKTIDLKDNQIIGLTNNNLSGNAQISNSNLANSAITINTSGLLTGSGQVSLGNSLTLGCPMCMSLGSTLFTVIGSSGSSSQIKQGGQLTLIGGNNITISNDGSGKITIANVPDTTLPQLSINNTGSGDLFIASSGGTTKFVITQDGKVGIGADNPEAFLDIVPSSPTDVPLRITSLQSSAPLSANLVVNGTFDSNLSSWNDSGSNWKWSSGQVQHIAGSADTLSQNIPVTKDAVYQIGFTISGRTTGSIIVQIGSVYIYNIGVSTGFPQNSGTIIRTLIAGATGNIPLTITPASNFNGSIDNITVNQVANTSQDSIEFVDANGNISFQARADATLNNTFLGLASGGYNITGYNNTATGINTLYYNTTGYQNTANGLAALYNNTNGYNNTAYGYNALYSNTNGYQNTADGLGALYYNSTGYQNSVSGYYALSNNTTGYNNTALGFRAGVYIHDGSTSNKTSNNSLYLGYNTMSLSSGDTNEIVIGASAIGIGANTVTLGNDNILTTALKGNVGVGTTNPSGVLDVQGNIVFGVGTGTQQGQLKTDGVNASARLSYPSNGAFFIERNGGNGVKAQFGGGNVESDVNFYVDTTGNVRTPASLCVKAGITAPCSGNTAGSIYATNTNITNADYAENYISSQTLEPGDLVVASNDGNNQAIIKSTDTYQQQLIGVVSTNPGIVLNSDATTDSVHPNKYPIALSGRIPVKVNTENGDIAVGDFLTSSSQPGIAMKATKAGVVIGKALEKFSCSGSSPCSGTIMVFVSVGYQNSLLAPTPTLTPTPQPTITPMPTVTQDNLFHNIADFFTHVVFQKDIHFSGKTYIDQPIFSGNSVGTATITNGETTTHVTFAKPYDQKPIITLTLSLIDGQEGILGIVQYGVFNADTKGFDIKINKSFDKDIQFNWTAFASSDETNNVATASAK